MKKFQITLASLFFSLLCMVNMTFASEITVENHSVAKSRKHHHDSSSSSSSSDSHEGKRGIRGERGHRGKRGHRGHHGRTSGPGTQGPQGIQGVSGGGTSPITTFISAAWVIPNTGSTQINQGSPIPFNTLVQQGGLTTPYVSGSGIFQVNDTGHYEITYAAKWTTSTPIALQIFDGTTTTIPSASILLSTNDYAIMSLIIPVTVIGTTFQIIPCPPPIGGGFLTFAGAGLAPSTRATFTITKIADL